MSELQKELSEISLAKARVELNEDTNVVDKSIELLRAKIEGHRQTEDLKCPELTDRYILRFLRARKHDLDSAFEVCGWNHQVGDCENGDLRRDGDGR